MNIHKIVISKTLLDKIYAEGTKELKDALLQIKQGTQYPLLQVKESKLPDAANKHITCNVGIEDVYITSKEVGAVYSDDKLLTVLNQFYLGEGQLPISADVTASKGEIKFKVRNGYHRLIASHFCSLKEVPVKYDQEEYTRVSRELHTTPAPSKEKYVPPHQRNKQMSATSQ